MESISTSVWFWLFAMIAFSVMEGLTVQLVSIWFAVSSLICMVLALFDVHLGVQLFVFVFASCVQIWLTRPFFKRKMAQRYTPNNVEVLLSHIGLVKETIDNLQGTGRVFVDGLTWTARSLDGTTLPVDWQVQIHHVEGVKLIVTPFAPPEHPAESSAPGSTK